MPEIQTQEQAKAEILQKVKEYYEAFHQPKASGGTERIPYAGRVYDDAEMVNLVDAALDFWLTAGPYARNFEQGLADFLGVPHCALVNSGSSANLLGFMALTSPLLGEQAIKRGDEVITVAAAFPTTVAPIVQYGAVPVFVDVSMQQYNIDVSVLEQALSPKTKAVVLAHTLGNPFDIQTVRDFCNAHHLWLLEDNCDALGSVYTYNGTRALTGTVGDIGTSSFYPPHQMTLGEGGAVYTRNPLLFKIILSLRDWGRDCTCPSGVDNLCKHRFDGQFGTLPKGYDHKYVYSHFGYNLKATDLQAAVGCAQLEKLPAFIKKRKENFQFFQERLCHLKEKLIFPQPLPNSDPCWFGFLMVCRDGIDRNNMVRHLEENGIQTRMLFSGNILCHPCFLHLQEAKDYRIVGTLSNTNAIMNGGFWIGVYPGLTNKQREKVAMEIEAALR